MQAVLSAASIVDVVSGYTSLRKRGATYSGLCPFHQEKTPSFTVSADKGLYYCFGCGEGGDVVRFLERMENLSFAEAIEQLGERFGVPVEYEEGAGPDPGRKDRDARLLQALEKAATFYQRFLWETESGRAAREYLEKRGLGEEVCRTFRVGFSPDEWRGLHRRAAKEGFTDRELDDAGLLVRQAGKTYDRFRGRLMFPLVDHRGRVLGFGGRTLKDETPKYLNSPEGPLYQKGHLLYGLYQARKAIADADEVVVVEGYTDVLGLVQAGVGNVVASMGTALTDAQIGLMMRFTGNVTFMFDADRAGTEAMLRSGELARGHSLRPMVAVLPGGRDPADVAVDGGQGGRLAGDGGQDLAAGVRAAAGACPGRHLDGRRPGAGLRGGAPDHEPGLVAQGAGGGDPAGGRPAPSYRRTAWRCCCVEVRAAGRPGRDGPPRRRAAARRSERGRTGPAVLAQRLLGQRGRRRARLPGGGRLQSGAGGANTRGAHPRALRRSQQPRGLHRSARRLRPDDRSRGSPGRLRSS